MAEVRSIRKNHTFAMHTLARVVDRLPVFPGDVGGAEDAPADGILIHGHCAARSGCLPCGRPALIGVEPQWLTMVLEVSQQIAGHAGKVLLPDAMSLSRIDPFANRHVTDANCG